MCISFIRLPFKVPLIGCLSRNIFSKGQKSEIKGLAEPCPLESSRGESVPRLSPCFWWLPAILEAPWL